MGVPRGWKTKGGGVTRGEMQGVHAAWGKNCRMGASRAGGKPGGRAAREKNAEWAIREERKGRVGAEGRCRAEAQRGSSEGWARREERLRVEVTRGQTQGGAAARKIGSVGAPRGKTQGGATARKLGRERGP